MTSRYIQTLYHEDTELTSYRSNVVCVRDASKITLNSCWWYTASTAKAMNHALRNTNYQVSRKQGMFILWYKGTQVCQFEDTCTFNPCIKAVTTIDNKPVAIEYGKD
jgi:hypothetical protein